MVDRKLTSEEINNYLDFPHHDVYFNTNDNEVTFRLEKNGIYEVFSTDNEFRTSITKLELLSELEILKKEILEFHK